jgi:transketolase
LQQLKKNKRFIDAGVAEQNLINIAAGLSSQKKKTLIYGFCTFLSFRCYEQIRFNIASHNLDCKIVGIGPGLSFPYDGPTHHGIHDLYLMYLIPEMEIINISDNNLSNLISKNIFKIKGPAYIRLDKGNCNFNTCVDYNLSKGFEFTNKNQKSKFLAITTGSIVNSVNQVSKMRNDLDVINIFRFKNFNKSLLIKILNKYNKIFVIDENTYDGGIIPIVNKYILTAKIKTEVKYLAIPNKQIFFYNANRDILLKKFKLDILGINQFIK